MFKAKTDDPRICLSWGTGTIRLPELGMTCAVVSLHRKVGDEEPIALHACSAAEARSLAMELWKRAEEADRANAAEEAKKEEA